jgi:phenylacetate-CoA ligase
MPALQVDKWTRRAINTASVFARGRVERTVPFWPAVAVGQLQQIRLRSMVHHAYRTVPFYREAMDERGLSPSDFARAEDLSELPLIDAQTVQENLDSFVSSEFRDDRSRKVSYTSGSTTGVRRTVYWDYGDVVRSFAYEERVWPIILGLAGYTRARILLRDGVGEPVAQAIMRAIGRGGHAETLSIQFPTPSTPRFTWVWNAHMVNWRPRIESRTLSPLEPFDLAVDRINEIRPQIIFSFGSYADQFVRFLAESGREAALPGVWVYTGDAVSAGGRDLAAERGCSLFSSYNATEVGRIGFHCERCDRHHLNVDLTPVRLIDGHGSAVEPGTAGEVVVSSLRNRALVLLNYRLGDLAILSPELCHCGRSLPLLERLEGRRTEIITLADGRTISSLTLEAMFRHELRPALKIQIAHDEPGHIRWRVVPFADIDRESLVASVRVKAEELGPGNRVSVEFVDDIPSSSAGKLRKVIGAG